MLPRPYRLKDQNDFKKIAKQGNFIFLKELGVKFIRNNLKIPRFGFIVSNKIDKRAVARNRIKRRFREIIHQNLKKIKSGFDILIIARAEIKGLNFWQMKERLEGILEKTGLLL